MNPALPVSDAAGADRLPWGRIIGLAATLAALWLLWNTRVVYPIRILVTFLHESSHGLAAVLTGGRVDRITVASNGSGLCFSRGGWRWVILPAGYLGSMFWGSVILITACRTRWGKVLSLVLGLGLVALTFFYVRSWFGFAAGLLIGAALASAGRWLPEDANEALLTCIGSASCLYAIFDIRDITRVSGPTDASMFSAEIFPLPPAVWAVLWGALAVVCLAVALRVALAPGRSR
jgi:hypothetical protein